MKNDVEAVAAWLLSLSPEDRRDASKLMARLEPGHAREVAKKANAMIKQAVRTGCSMPRIIAMRIRGVPVKDKGMVKGRFGVRVGDAEETLPTKRWTPPQAVTTEDRYDGMDVLAALFCSDPPSPTGRQFTLIRETEARVECQRTKQRKEQGDRGCS